ncbi:MAG: nucleoside triphosphate pyrophosphohydrolase [Candidatus Marinimicrobia bacterium]|nr:nucleoside triphosphate pyrophosphohydrolase [Candidatus Neomarinimicrobiota bacterium]
MKSLDELIAIVRILRSPEGCPWDREQNSRSLLPYFLEEVHETIDAVNAKNYEQLRKELGDVLLHVVFQILIAEEEGQFGFEEVFEGINAKMRRRHPHVFQKDREYSKEEVNRNWERYKRKDPGEHLLDGIPRALPELHRSFRMQQKAAAVGFDWDDVSEVWKKLDEELEEFREAKTAGDRAAMENEMGDILFALVNLSRFYGLHPEQALQRSNDKFYRRFTAIEDHYKKKGASIKDAGLQELDRLWEEIKKEEFR